MTNPSDTQVPSINPLPLPPQEQSSNASQATVSLIFVVSVTPARIADSRINQQINGAVPKVTWVSYAVAVWVGLAAVFIAVYVVSNPKRREKQRAVNQWLAEQDPQNPGHLDRWDKPTEGEKRADRIAEQQKLRLTDETVAQQN